MPALPTDLRAAIIDLDGTLIDTAGDFEVALAAMLAEFGLGPVSGGFIRRTIGRGSEHLITCTLVEAGADPSLFEQAWARYQHHYGLVNGSRSAVFPGIAEGMADLEARGWPLACVTNKPGRFARQLLAAKGLAERFVCVIGGDEVANKKPHPEPLLSACGRLGTPPAQTLMVGDSRNDAEAARAAGCPVVLVSHGYNHGEAVEDARPDAVLADLSALAALLTSRPR